jgi:hypothetical protein
MGVERIEASKVTCQRCDAAIIVEKWWDARKHGWAVPRDGQVQLCPTCLAYHKGILSAIAIPAELLEGPTHYASTEATEAAFKHVR